MQPAHRVRFPTALGDCGVAWTDAGLAGFSLPGDGTLPAAAPADSVVLPPEIAGLIDAVQRHLSGTPRDFRDARYDWARVSPFQQAVLRATLAVGPGRTASYGEIATAIGEPPSSSRAVAAALGANPWPLLVPCHRIVGADGKMTGFSGPGGVQTKLRLLALEGAQWFDA